MTIALWPLLFLIVGVLLFTLASNAKVVRIGEIMVWVGMFWLVYSLSGKTLKLGS